MDHVFDETRFRNSPKKPAIPEENNQLVPNCTNTKESENSFMEKVLVQMIQNGQDGLASTILWSISPPDEESGRGWFVWIENGPGESVCHAGPFQGHPTIALGAGISYLEPLSINLGKGWSGHRKLEESSEINGTRIEQGWVGPA
jgi:hypothetical protein